HAVAQPASVRWLQVRPAARRTRGHARHEVDRGARERVPRDGLRGVARVPFERASAGATTPRDEDPDPHLGDLPSVVDLEGIGPSGVRIGVDPLGGASLAYWDAIGERYGLALEVVNHTVDPTFRFMTVDWDGQIRMDPSSPYAMARMVELKDRFDVAFA